MKTVAEWRSYYNSVGVYNTGRSEINEMLADMEELEGQIDRVVKLANGLLGILDDKEVLECKVKELEQQVSELSVRLAVALQALKETEREHDGA
jgi:uncharacterized protein YaaN involved in tellurite resistance